MEIFFIIYIMISLAWESELILLKVHIYDPTIEDSYSITLKIDGVSYHISLVDTAGQEACRSIWAHQDLAADGFLMVYDITSYQKLSKLEYFNTMIEVEADTRLGIMND